MGAMASEITGVSIVCSTVCSGGHQRKHQSSASLAFLRWIHRWPVDSPHKGSVRREMFPFEYVIMETAVTWCRHYELLLMSFVVVGLGLLLERRTISTNNAPALWKVYMYAQNIYTLWNPYSDVITAHIYSVLPGVWFLYACTLYWPNMMTSSNGNIFRVTGTLFGEFTGHRWIPLPHKASDAELWCFLWSTPEQTVE